MPELTGVATTSIEPRVPFFEHLGIRLRSMKDGHSELEMTHTAEISNSRGDVHGGSLSALLEAALLMAVRSSLPPGARAATAAVNAAFVLPGRGTMIGFGRVIRVGGTIGMAEGRVETEDGTVVATGSGVFRIFRPTPLSGNREE